ncbi:hypothetical protein MUO14_02630 [Halobacillus shinanisalinarum]|uniref:Uncharacterized protein n=1 Tax=Halobacillus shinanisalinarum TaxID=2932258 RepID=A0ABY4H0D1_9BACI|nr:hypothetical protein [Halobacillus shinanisalinarum]UOQ93897.1 hypothetical protein MUO14_02630 [Halobacillus shinanisalinarum]
MDRVTLHEQVLSLKGKIFSGQLKFRCRDDYILQQLDKVKEEDDGLIDVSTVSSSLIILLDATKDESL